MTDVLIIEDDLSLANEIKNMIENADEDFQVCGIRNSVGSATYWLMNNKLPQLIFCDIKFEDGLSFEIFQHFPITVPVIFCTAYHEYALEAFEYNGIDYLIKPIDNRKLRKSLKKFIRLRELLCDENTTLERPVGTDFSFLSNYKSSLLVYYQDKIIPVSLDQLDFIYYNNYQVTVHTQNTQYETRDTLNNIITTLNPRDFFRANRQFIIHRKAVASIQQYFGRKLLIDTTTPTPEPIIISKANASEFLKWLEGISWEIA